MATVTNKWKVLSVEGIFQVIREVENGENRSLSVKSEPKLLVSLNGTGRQ